jgi:hypothetical protein
VNGDYAGAMIEDWGVEMSKMHQIEMMIIQNA